ncbi:MAG: L,D-transpeptidase family protein [Actinomycetia bacterium]|nr:L,D-transpeptidase family protein [Actinomycetes bacterium]
MKRRATITFAFLLAVLAAGVLAASVLADTPPPATTTTATTTGTTTTGTTTTGTTTIPAQVIPDGVTVGAVAVGGMAPDVAVQAVLTAFQRPVVLRIARTTISVTPDLLGATVPADSAVAKALTVAPNTTLGLRASVNRPALDAFVARIAARFDRKPTDSRLLFRNFKPVVTPSVAGLRVNRAATAAAVSDEVVHGTRAPITVPAKDLKPKVAESSFGPVVVIRRASNLLTLYNGMRPVRQFAVATGQTIYPTPLGRFQIVVKWKNPWWYPPASPWAKGEKPTPPGPNNPLGTRWMGISSPGVGIHGTPQDGSIGYSLSHGCVRMHIPQAEWLFDHVDVGTPVYIVGA